MLKEDDVIKPYLKYLIYLLDHKKNVLLACWKRGLYIHGITHDLSKFLPDEFIPYARYFYIDKEKYQSDFDLAWEKHYTRNKHHWNHFYDPVYKLVVGMDKKHIKQMVCDWEAMSMKFGGSALEFYLENKKRNKINMSVYGDYVIIGMLDPCNIIL